MRYATRLDRFQIGDFPLVCVRSGLPADKFVPVEAARSASWPWFFFPLHLVTFVLARWRVFGDRVWGQLPFASGHVEGIRATWGKATKTVTIAGVHADFVVACTEAQGRPVS